VPTFIIIAALGQHRELGKNNKMLWHLPDDFKHFKKLTTGHYMIMGRKTFESLPGTLPNRTHIIITRDKNYTVDHENCLVAHSLEEAKKMVEEQREVYIIGGGQIYKQALEFSHVMELTWVHGTFDADTYFPEFDPLKWKVEKETFHEKDEKHKYSFVIKRYVKQS
jgi:dihydrofolate reductase